MASKAASLSAEYAKSGRSSCKGCGEAIAAGTLRLGTSHRDPRGFENKKWYHHACFPSAEHRVSSAEAFAGFDLLKNSDQNQLRMLEYNSASETDGKGNKRVDDVGQSNKGTKKQKIDVSDEPREKDDKGKGLAEGEIAVSDDSWKKDDKVTDLAEDEIAVSDQPRKKEDKGKGLAEESGVQAHMTIPFSPSEIRDTYKDAILPPNWKAFETVIFRHCEDVHDSAKIAAFDFDGCLARTSVRSIGADKWSLTQASVPVKLHGLHSAGYKLVIFTNESNIERWKNKRQIAVDSKVGRLDGFIKCINVPIQVFIACGKGREKGGLDDPFRKPNTGMWSLLTDHFNSGIAIDMDKSFYVGDAAGRPKDHSDADIKFAEAIGLKFYVPEDYFSTPRA